MTEDKSLPYVPATYVRRATYTAQVLATCAVDGEEFFADVEIRLRVNGYTLELGWLKRQVEDLTAEPTTAEQLCTRLWEACTEALPGGMVKHVRVTHHEREGEGIKLVVEA